MPTDIDIDVLAEALWYQAYPKRALQNGTLPSDVADRYRWEKVKKDYTALSGWRTEARELIAKVKEIQER